MSEMSFTHRVKSAGELLTVGDTIKVRVLSVDMTRKRVSLSLKRVGDDPWMGASARWPAGTIVDGVVTRLADFGAFVELTSGVEGLVHISELAEHRIRAVNEAVREGEAVKAKVLEVDEERHRISLSIRAIKIDPNYTGEASASAAAAAPSAAAPAAGTPAPAPAAAAQAPVAEQPKPEKKRKHPLKGGLDGPDWMGLLK
jgi:ribosomal protein S1